MKEFFTWLLSENNSELEIGLFDIWHFLYLFIIFGGGILVSILVSGKSEQVKEKTVRIFAYLVAGFYIADFFLMPLSDSYSGIPSYKLPFHICTIMGVMVPLVQFNKRLDKLKAVIVTLSVASSMMWMIYPGSALGGQPPFSYIIFQTFMYHGLLWCWGYLNLALGLVRLDIKKIWHELCAILIIMVWAFIGNTLYDGVQNWFFIEESIFPFLSDEIMPPVVIFCVFGTCFLVYCGYYLVEYIILQIRKRSVAHAVAEI